MNKNFLFFISITVFLIPRSTTAQDQYSLSARFYFETNDEIKYTDQFRLKADLKYDFFVTDNFECRLELEADKYEIDVEEIYFRYRFPALNIRGGKFKNQILLSNILSAREKPAAARNQVETLLMTQGYIHRGTGAGLESRKSYYSNNTFFLNLHSIDAHFFEPQLNAGFLHEFDSAVSAGISGAYFPFFIKQEYLGEDRDIDHNFVINMIAYKHEGTFIWGSEATFGKNIHHPIGMIYTGPYSDADYFIGADAYAGMRLYIHGKTEFLPLLRTTALFPDTGNMDCSIIEADLNSKFGFTEDIRLDLRSGIRTITEYDYTGKLITRLDYIWNIIFMVFI